MSTLTDELSLGGSTPSFAPTLPTKHAAEPYRPRCPICQGAGRKQVTVHPEDYFPVNKLRDFFTGKPVLSTVFTIQCLSCGGAGRVNAAQMQVIHLQQEMWCKCRREPSEGVICHWDAKPSWEWCVTKRHYHCDRCRKIVQIG